VTELSLIGALTFVGMWGVMMAGMMLPSALPTILLYRTVRRKLSPQGETAIPVPLFVATYLAMWTLFGVPVYAGYVIVGRLARASASFSTLVPYAVAATLIAAGLYQFTNLKRVCLSSCESPMSFLMRRWRSGYPATFRIALDHAAYCIGCCWALMLILVVAGAMSLPWVIGIAALVFIEKVLPHGLRAARVIGVVLIVLGLAVTVKPELAMVLRGASAGMQM
jgi:predicted metal-binding membrane protein